MAISMINSYLTLHHFAGASGGSTAIFFQRQGLATFLQWAVLSGTEKIINQMPSNGKGV